MKICWISVKRKYILAVILQVSILSFLVYSLQYVKFIEICAEKCTQRPFLCAEKCIFAYKLCAEKCTQQPFLCAEKCKQHYGKTCIATT